jgi:hypothetical protein
VESWSDASEGPEGQEVGFLDLEEGDSDRLIAAKREIVGLLEGEGALGHPGEHDRRLGGGAEGGGEEQEEREGGKEDRGAHEGKGNAEAKAS